MPMTCSDARKRLASPTIVPVERTQALSPAAADIALAFVAGWFVEHAELDRERYLTLVADAEAALS